MWISATIPIIQKQSEETDLWQQFSVKLSSYWTFLEHPEYFGRRLLTEASVVSRARSEGGSTSHHTYRDNITTSQNNLQWQQQQHSAKYCDMDAVWRYGMGLCYDTMHVLKIEVNIEKHLMN